MTGKKFQSDAHKNRVWSNRRKFGRALVEAGVITDEQIAAVLDALKLVSDLAALADEQRTHEPCTAIAIDLRDKLGNHTRALAAPENRRMG